MDVEPLPQYVRIAMDIASRIATGELEEHQKVSGRSVIASEYHVSPETARKAVRLLADMKVVEVQEKKGIYVLSADNAKRYMEMVSPLQERYQLRNQLRSLVENYREIGKQISDVAERLMRAHVTPLPQEKAVPNYEVKLAPGSDKIGKSIGQLHFWQSTGATIVAIRRNQNTILSPGPYAELYAGDVIVFTGKSECVTTVQMFLNGQINSENS